MMMKLTWELMLILNVVPSVMFFVVKVFFLKEVPKWYTIIELIYIACVLLSNVGLTLYAYGTPNLYLLYEVVPIALMSSVAPIILLTSSDIYKDEPTW